MISIFFSGCNLNSLCKVYKKNDFILTLSAVNNYATKANVGPADKAQRILKLRAVKTSGPNLRSALVYYETVLLRGEYCDRG
jgi:hypothetical protein